MTTKQLDEILERLRDYDEILKRLDDIDKILKRLLTDDTGDDAPLVQSPHKTHKEISDD